MKKNEKVATLNAEVRTIAWYEENLAKAKKEWHEIAQSYGVEDHQLVDLGFGDWVILNQNAECQETVCEANDDYETITDKQECRRLTYLNNVIDSWSEKIREMKNLEINNELISEARKHFAWCVWAFAKYAKENNQDKCVYLNNAVNAYKFYGYLVTNEPVGKVSASTVKNFACICNGYTKKDGAWHQTEAEKATWERIGDVEYWYAKGLENLNLENYENQL